MSAVPLVASVMPVPEPVPAVWMVTWGYIWLVGRAPTGSTAGRAACSPSRSGTRSGGFSTPLLGTLTAAADAAVTSP